MSGWATLSEEKAAIGRGHQLIAGIDEVGRGALAGPVTIGLVILPVDFNLEVTDSKLLSPKLRLIKAKAIRDQAIVCQVEHIEAGFIDSFGIVAAMRQAAQQAWDNLLIKPDLILLDGPHNYLDLPVSVKTIIRGDQISASIAAASIVAKVARDEMLQDLSTDYPEYGFASHVGYGTPFHRSALQKHGPTDQHRLTFLTKIL